MIPRNISGIQSSKFVLPLYGSIVGVVVVSSRSSIVTLSVSTLASPATVLSCHIIVTINRVQFSVSYSIQSSPAAAVVTSLAACSSSSTSSLLFYTIVRATTLFFISNCSSLLQLLLAILSRGIRTVCFRCNVVFGLTCISLLN